MNISDDPSRGINAAVARTINGERAAQNLTMDTLSEKAGIPDRTLIRYLNRQRHIPVASLDRLAKALNTTPSKLMRAAEKRRDADG